VEILEILSPSLFFLQESPFEAANPLENKIKELERILNYLE
jgi:hypothetical protein